jgi:hypothetical protein
LWQGGKQLAGNKAKAVAAAAAEIAKILAVPSARSIVEPGKYPAKKQARAGGDGGSSSSSAPSSPSSGEGAGEKKSGSAQSLTPWLHTPKDYDEFAYKKQKFHRLLALSLGTFDAREAGASQVIGPHLEIFSPRELRFVAWVFSGSVLAISEGY